MATVFWQFLITGLALLLLLAAALVCGLVACAAMLRRAEFGGSAAYQPRADVLASLAAVGAAWVLVALPARLALPSLAVEACAWLLALAAGLALARYWLAAPLAAAAAGLGWLLAAGLARRRSAPPAYLVGRLPALVRRALHRRLGAAAGSPAGRAACHALDELLALDAALRAVRRQRVGSALSVEMAMECRAALDGLWSTAAGLTLGPDGAAGPGASAPHDVEATAAAVRDARLALGRLAPALRPVEWSPARLAELTRAAERLADGDVPGS